MQNEGNYNSFSMTNLEVATLFFVAFEYIFELVLHLFRSVKLSDIG